MKPPGIITLTTDFGLRDPYVAAMKGVILNIHPGAVLVDITHEIAPGSVSEAADVLLQAAPFFPPGTVHVAVVDPGVGTARRAIAAKCHGHFLVGPDNGLFWPLLRTDPAASLVHLVQERFFHHPVSRTFHGRDLFAPVGAHLALGRDLREMGNTVSDPVSLVVNRPRVEGDALLGEVSRVDRFGNLVTNISSDDLEEFLNGREPFFQAGDLELRGIRSCYGDVRAGESLALIGSAGTLELSVNGGKASDLAGKESEETGPGMIVRVTTVA